MKKEPVIQLRESDILVRHRAEYGSSDDSAGFLIRAMHIKRVRRFRSVYRVPPTSGVRRGHPPAVVAPSAATAA